MSPKPDSLHPQMAAALRMLGQLELAKGSRLSLPVHEQRRLMTLERGYWNEPVSNRNHAKEPLETRRFVLDGPYRQVPIHVFRPRSAGGRPFIIYLHGGGWMLGSVRTHESILRGLALASGCMVLGVDYALAPEFSFPQPVEETRRTIKALHAMAPELGANQQACIVAGDSAGANVALAAALQVEAERPGLICAGIFYYGVFDDDLTTGSAALYGDGRFGLSAEKMRHYWTIYLSRPEDRRDPRANLCLAELSGAFPMFLMAAGCDILRDGAGRFAERLRHHGIAHRFSVRPGMGHAFMGYGRMIDDVDAVHIEAAAFIADCYARKSGR